MDDSYKAKQTQNPKDGDTPFSAPDDVDDKVDDTHPQTDTNVDTDETYHHGLPEVIKIDDPTEPDETELMNDSH